MKNPGIAVIHDTTGKELILKLSNSNFTQVKF